MKAIDAEPSPAVATREVGAAGAVAGIASFATWNGTETYRLPEPSTWMLSGYPIEELAAGLGVGLDERDLALTGERGELSCRYFSSSGVAAEVAENVAVDFVGRALDVLDTVSRGG